MSSDGGHSTRVGGSSSSSSNSTGGGGLTLVTPGSLQGRSGMSGGASLAAIAGPGVGSGPVPSPRLLKRRLAPVSDPRVRYLSTKISEASGVDAALVDECFGDGAVRQQSPLSWTVQRLLGCRPLLACWMIPGA